MALGAGRRSRRRAGRCGRGADQRADGIKPAVQTVEPGMNDQILEQLVSSQQLVIAMLRVSTEDPSARVGAWDLRDIAAHLAASERDCYVPRIRAIAAGENPTFDFFTNDGTDFSGIHLDDALDEWTATRMMLIGYVKTLDGEQRALTGRHERYG